MNPQIVTKPAFTAVGLKRRGTNNNREVPQLWDQFVPRLKEVKHRVVPHVSYGIMYNYDPATYEFDYLAGEGVEKADDIPEGMSSWDVPGGMYAVFPTTLAAIRTTMNEIYQSWLPTSGYQHGGTPDFEYYDEHFDGSPTSTMYVYVPVTK